MTRALVACCLAVLVTLLGCAEEPALYVEAGLAHDGGLVDGATYPGDGSAEAGNPPLNAACVRALFPARGLPLELAVIVNTEPVWAQEEIQRALTEFADTAQINQLSLAVQFTPHPTAIDYCDSHVFETPFVPMTRAPQVADEIRAAFDATKYAYGDYSARAAMVGTIAYLQRRRELNPLSQHAILLVMSSVHGYCYSEVENVATVAESAYAMDPPILTFVYGPEDSYRPDLDPVAAAGGTGEGAYPNPDAGEVWVDLVETLTALRLKATACNIALPVPDEGTLDTERVEVQFREAVGKPLVTWPLLSSGGDCLGGRDGFYYDNLVNPRTIKLCPASCAIARTAAVQGQLSVAAECVRVIE